MDCSLPGSSVHGIFQARVLEWGAIAFSDTGEELVAKGLTVFSSSDIVMHSYKILIEHLIFSSLELYKVCDK